MKKFVVLMTCFFFVGISFVDAGTICIQGQSTNTKKCTKGEVNDVCDGTGSDCAGMSSPENPPGG